MKDDLKGIGTSGRPGRGNGSTSPSRAARSLAGPAAKKATGKSAAKKAAKTSGTKPTSAAQADAATSASARSAAPKQDAPRTAKKTAAKRTAAKKAAAKTTTTKAASAKKAAPKKATPPPVEPEQPTTGRTRERHLRAVPEDEGQDHRQEAPREATADIDPEDVAAAFAEGARRLMGTDWQVKVLEIVGSLRRRLSGSYEVDEFGLDPEVLDLLSHLVEPLAESWFRLEVRGVENIPTDGGALLVANHSGTVPVDGLITGYAVRKHTGRPIRPLGADLVFRLPYVGQVARKMGATLACAEDAERLLTSGELAAVWPEGFKGIGKPFSERYKLQRFGRGGFVSSAMRAQVPIVPVSIVGAEEIYPLVGNIPSLARLLGVPYIPITPFFPLFGPLGLIPLPSKWIIEFGEPVRTDAYAPESADDPMLLFNVTDQVRETIQQTLYSLLVERGNPFI
ncbi:acyltransferase family protein [Aeromicrobium tamlense]|uniref:1-acyl-sn-glycerol-3-phosphate acyltransferase n=1 Tax=Aeromicrobium tamlense TaxID=375541 RepID=A0A8I0KGB2_9ACTN|nr:lysophospholipid acyltransferase family protein [Aeromicrobium tamlense]MBD1269391.1 acyltransferase family protein [Aeromicrobium tamlense]NYI36701.1 1-acyl-sn-glycerol-3-phosphate acyltransferase [Aeromicrobium tamlense]